MQFQLDEFHRDIPDEELLQDLKRADEVLRKNGRALTFRSYTSVGKFSAGTFAVRFGSWNKALASARIPSAEEKNVSVDALFDKLRIVWSEKGKQPVFRDMSVPPSRYHASLYAVRFGSWRKALRTFVDFVQSKEWVRND